MNITLFGELISSNNFFLLLQRALTLFNPHVGLGTYLQGIPVSNTVDFFWGTNAGIRTLPLLFNLSILQILSPSSWELIYLLFSILLPFIMFFLAYRLIGKITVFTFIGALLYGANVWIIDRIFTGFWQLNIVYAFLPFLVTIPIKVSKNKKLSNKYIFYYSCLISVIASIILTSQPHFLVIVGIFLMLYCALLLINKKFIESFNLLKLFFFALIIFSFINAYFIIPGILYPELFFTIPNQYFSLASVLFNGQGNQIENVLRFAPNGFSQIAPLWSWIEYLQLLPLIIFLVLFIVNKKRNYLYLGLIVLFLFFAKGLNAPAENLSRWIYQNIFFMHYFRDPARFLSGVALFSSLGVAGLTIERKLTGPAKVIIITIVIVLFTAINIRSLQPPKTQILNETTIPNSYIMMQNYINKYLSNDSEYRLLVLPSTLGLPEYPWYTDPSPNSSRNIFDNILPLTMPLANGTNYPDTYSNQVAAFLYTKFTQTYDNAYLKPLGIKYILVDSSITATDSDKDIATKAATLLREKGYTLMYKEHDLSLFKVASPSSVISSQQPIFAVGNLNTITKPYLLGDNRPVVLLNQPINVDISKVNNLIGKSLLIDTTNPSLVLAGEQLAKDYSVDIISAGWNYDQIFGSYEPYKMLYIASSGELYTSERAVISSRTITKPMQISHTLNPGKYIILIKALTNDPASFTINLGSSKKEVILNTKEKLLWKNVGTINVDHKLNSLTLEKNETSQIIIDQLLFVPEEKYIADTDYFKQLLSTMKPYKYQAGSILPEADIKMVTNSEVELVKTTKNLTYLVSFGKYWKSDNSSQTFFSNGYGMTFMSSNKPINEISYVSNRTYIFALFVSVISLLLAVIYCVFYKLKKGPRSNSENNNTKSIKVED